MLSRALLRNSFRESGSHEVVKLHPINCANTLAIARVDEPAIEDRIAGNLRGGADIIVKVGTDLVMTRLADELSAPQGCLSRRQCGHVVACSAHQQQ